MQSTFHCPKIHCNHCAMTIKVELGDLLGVKTVEVDVDAKNVFVTYDAPVTEEAIKKLLLEIGYPAE
jgi:copper chaperone